MFRRHWDHEPGRRNGARLCEPQHVALQTKLLRVTDPRSETRFMAREVVLFIRFGELDIFRNQPSSTKSRTFCRA